MDMPSRQLARIIYNENALRFKDYEEARTIIRYIEGKKGNENIKYIKNTEFFMEEKRPLNPHKMPNTWAKPKQIFKLPIGCNKVGVISDLQIPFHDIVAIEAAIGWLKNKEINTLFINGDLLDWYNLSDFEKDLKRRDTKAEIDIAVEILRWIRYELPDVTIYYNTNANHELRWERWIIRKAPELFDLLDYMNVNISGLLKLDELKIIELKDYIHCMIGKMPILHGHTIFGKFANQVSKAKTLFDKLLHGGMCSHVHVTDECNRKDNVTGKMFTTWTTGCLMDLNVEYNPHNNQYNHGFAYVETDIEGNYTVENKRIKDGKVL
jgi:hypothetical protein